jgi:hypothetical protein
LKLVQNLNQKRFRKSKAKMKILIIFFYTFWRNIIQISTYSKGPLVQKNWKYWKKFAINPPKIYSKNLLQKVTPKSYSKKLLQKVTPKSYSKKLLQKVTPKSYSKKLLQKVTPNCYDITWGFLGSATKFYEKIRGFFWRFSN